MPLPPAEELEENKEESAEPKLQFSFVECLLYAFHNLAKNVSSCALIEEPCFISIYKEFMSHESG
jgi:hypothetical protein